jgi:hypothetical protein
VLNETDLKDEYENVVIQPGLKVRHNKSQFEYTVEDVIQDQSGEVTVILRMPEDPRFEPPSADDVVLTDRADKEKILYEVDPEAVYFEPDLEDTTDEFQKDFLAVPQAEFEQEYEVK